MLSEIKGLSVEQIGGVKLHISAVHRFGTDAFLLADFAAPRHKDTVCDLCSGCGIVAAVMYERFRPKSIEAVEIDREGYELMTLTAESSALENFKPVCGDLKDWRAERELDLITCNPPYKRDGAGIKSAGEVYRDVLTLEKFRRLQGGGALAEIRRQALRLQPSRAALRHDVRYARGGDRAEAYAFCVQKFGQCTVAGAVGGQKRRQPVFADGEKFLHADG